MTKILIDKETVKWALEASRNLLCWDNGQPEYVEAQRALKALRQALKESSDSVLREQSTEQEPVAHCEAGPEYCWKCNEEIKPTYGSEESRRLREVNKSLNDHIVDANKKVEPPPWWPAVENILNEYGLQAIDFVSDFKQAIEQAQKQEPVAWVKRATEWLLDLPNTPTDAPYFTNGVFKGDCQELAALLQTSTAPPQRQPLTDDDITKVIEELPQGINGWMSDWDLYEFTRAIEAAHGIKE